MREIEEGGGGWGGGGGGGRGGRTHYLNVRIETLNDRNALFVKP